MLKETKSAVVDTLSTNVKDFREFVRNCSSVVNALNDILSFGLVETDPDALLRVYHLATLEDEKYLIQEENILSRNEVAVSLSPDL